MFKDALNSLMDKGKIAVMNEKIAEGLAFHQIGDNLYKTIHSLLKRELGKSNKQLPEGFYYSGYSIKSPEEMFGWQSNTKASKSPGVDVSRSDYYMVDFKFKMRDDRGMETEIVRALLVPYVNPYNIINVNGGARIISAVWHQPGLGYVNDGFFVHFPFSKRITFKFESFTLSVHGVDERCYLTTTETLKSRNGSGKTNLPIVAYWLFAKYGFQETVKRYTGIDVEVYSSEFRGGDEINLDEVTVIQYNRVKRGVENFIVTIPRDQMERDSAKRTPAQCQALSMISALFYAQSYQPHHLSEDILDDPDVWTRVLGYSLEGRSAADNEAQLFKEMEKNFIEIERYCCSRFKHELLESGVDDVESIWDFLFHVIRSTIEVHNVPRSELSNVYGKCLKTVDYLFSGEKGLAVAINEIRWKLTTLADKEFELTGTRVVKATSIARVVNHKLFVSVLTKITSGHGEVSHLSSTCECPVIGVTTHAIDQTDATKKNRGKKKSGKTINIDDPVNFRHVSRMEGGSYGYVTKASPFGLGTLNAYATLGSNYELIQNPKFKEITDRTQEDLRQRGRLIQ
mgnify:CR=1 FL=1